MRIYRHNFKVACLGSLSCAALAACSPSHHMAADTHSVQMGYGYAQTAYGYEYAASEQTVTTFSSRYGGELRGPCEVEEQSCGLMRVVPVYPLYQYVTFAQSEQTEYVETPPVIIPDPAPLPVPEPPVYIPEPPVYVPPVQHYPDPETPPPVWTPPRK